MLTLCCAINVGFRYNWTLLQQRTKKQIKKNLSQNSFQNDETKISKDTIDYSESLNNPSWDNERKWAKEIMKV